MRQIQPEWDRRNIACLVVTFEQPKNARQYVEEFSVDWPMLVDVDRTLYQAFGLNPRAGFWNLFRPSFWPCYIKLILQGRRVKLPTGDVKQLGGDVLIDPQGIVRLHWKSSTSVDRPEPERLLEVVDQSNSNS